ncbi:class F sortase [Streptomyces xylophagus]|uniref:class F sortase n=1 Tax=Streptomyces xylophagus TaxID=285514 RepID=UPI002D219342|nr:class F sortase [Streptomyces xylophagus]
MRLRPGADGRRAADTLRPRHLPRPTTDGWQAAGRTSREAPGRTTTGVVRRRPPWYRTRAYRLTRTLVLTVALMVGGARCAGGADASGSARAGSSVTNASGPAETVPSATDASGSAPAASSATDTSGQARAASSTPDIRMDARGGQRPSPGHPVARPGRQAPPPHQASPPPPRTLPRSPATALSIPYLDVDAPVMPLRLGPDRRMSAPPDDDPKRVGWYADGPAPGEQGTAVAVGHLDTMTGPAVFAGLGELKPDHLIEVRRADGRTAVYMVDAVKTYEKAHFPDREVYGARGRPELRLITCGGSYDRRTGYAGNTVVFAHLTAIRERARTG